MRCAWDNFIRLLPEWMREEVDKLGKADLQEFRLRIDRPPELITGRGSFFLRKNTCKEDLNYVINGASRYSPWSAQTIKNGYITAPGGHRLGICGECVTNGDRMEGIRIPSSVCIRIARDFPGISKEMDEKEGSVLILGRPGSGKTTLLRDLIRRRSEQFCQSVCVIDEREELFPVRNGQIIFAPGLRTDVMTGCPKYQGIEMGLRTMGPGCIAVDEITREEDCQALLECAMCGVDVLATVHASGKEDMLSRGIYRKILNSGIFDHFVVMQKDKSWRLERMVL